MSKKNSQQIYIKNKIYYNSIWNYYIYFSLIIFIVLFSLLISTSYFLFEDISSNFFIKIAIILTSFIILVIGAGVIGRYPHKGPLKVWITNDSLLIEYSFQRKQYIRWKSIYGITEKDEVCIPEGFFKCKKTKEYRVYYYKGNKLKWFCVSEEVGNKIISMWEEWKKQEGMNAKKPSNRRR